MPFPALKVQFFADIAETFHLDAGFLSFLVEPFDCGLSNEGDFAQAEFVLENELSDQDCRICG